MSSRFDAVFERSLRGHGLKELCKDLNDRGITNRGKRWYKSGLHYLLTNEAYTGTAVWGRTVKGVPAPDPDIALFIEGHRFPIDDPSTMALFTAAVSRVVLARVEDRSLVVSAWTPEAGLTETRLP